MKYAVAAWLADAYDTLQDLVEGECASEGDVLEVVPVRPKTITEEWAKATAEHLLDEYAAEFWSEYGGNHGGDAADLLETIRLWAARAKPSEHEPAGEAFCIRVTTGGWRRE